ncbi:right-handed parallel beta-helix repeat-containing protein [Sphingobium sp. JS3065]|uniref:right-handed parallel beta-helix repeat-containing protein n=1 Tax=Sphingobium sp. JS3065 TaxID=2970925 RepID=UPI0022647578|nr:right-handed parallel beta-helix repeat-containing protein [Sphingobium sp. JS3065]UZW55419.1 right-handed parallel beta-helix repeat-containing protein [Sphingobium sp. JS3065]
MRKYLWAFLLLSPGLIAAAHAETYYVDSNLGNDSASGTARDQPWRTLARINGWPLQPGDQILLAAGSVWREPLTITRSGKPGAPITIAATGAGARPRIDAGGVSEYAVGVIDAEYVAVGGLEVTNDAPTPSPRTGILVRAENRGVTRGIRISDNYVHHVRGTNERKDNGGIVFSATGRKVATRFRDLAIERNIVWRVDRSGIAGISDRVSFLDWFPSEKVVIRDNYLEDIGGDGIVPRGTDGALIEHNIVRHAGSRAPGYNAGIWQWSTDNSLIQLNEAAYTRTRYDGQGFDSDYNSRRTTFLYNYSHDNAGGFLLICSPRRNDKDNLGNRGTVARFNVSRNDGTRIFQLSGNVSDALIERNVIHVGRAMDVQMIVATEWQGWARDVRFQHNIFKVAGTARYGSENGRDGPDYLIKAGFSPAEAIRFRRNAYIGNHVDLPEDGLGQSVIPYQESASDWQVPTFDPATPDGFAEFLVRHRAWMLAMLTRELASPVTPRQPRRSSIFEARR